MRTLAGVNSTSGGDSPEKLKTRLINNRFTD